MEDDLNILLNGRQPQKFKTVLKNSYFTQPMQHNNQKNIGTIKTTKTNWL